MSGARGRRPAFRSSLGLLLAAAFLGCAAPQRQSQRSSLRPPRPPQVESVREVEALRFVSSVRARDGGHSARFGGRSVWVFGDTVLSQPGADGERWRSSTWCATEDFDARDGLSALTDPLDAAGAPGEFLPFTEEEAAYNAEHFRPDLPDERFARWALWPGPVAVDPESGRAVVFYAKIHARRGAWDFEAVGHSAALWERPEAAPDRRGTTLFPSDDIVLGQGAVVHGGRLYAYGCRTVGLSWPCVVARVRFEDAMDRSAWTFWAGDGRWSADADDAVPALQAAPMLSVHWNAHLGAFLAAYSVPLTGGLAVRTAPAPEGPWSDAVVVHEGLPPGEPGAWNYAGLAHAELAREGGKVEYLTYYRPTGFLAGEMRLVEVRFR